MGEHSALGTLLGGVIAIHLVKEIIHHKRKNKKSRKTPYLDWRTA